MYDVRPVQKRTGEVDWEKIRKAGKEYDRRKEQQRKAAEEYAEKRKLLLEAAEIRRREMVAASERFRVSEQPRERIFPKETFSELSFPVKTKRESHLSSVGSDVYAQREIFGGSLPPRKKGERIKAQTRAEHFFTWHDLFSGMGRLGLWTTNISPKPFVLVSMTLLLLVGTTAYLQKGLIVKERVLGVQTGVMENFKDAARAAQNKDFSLVSLKFAEAQQKLTQASLELETLGKPVIASARFLPGASQLSSGKYALDAAGELAGAAKEVSMLGALFASPQAPGEEKGTSLLEIFQESSAHADRAAGHLSRAQQSLEKVSVEDVPEDKRALMLSLKAMIAEIADLAAGAGEGGEIVADMLGGNGPRKYLFLFQNNAEMRPTGGFIGSYALLEMSDGKVRNFFIDGIFNPDGQLTDKIVPPLPIQKISAAWSLHDSNWWPDFPTSARKAADFYEKTGGPTVDGVITLTPEVLKKLLAVTGPIEMPKYEVTLTAENFVEKTQYEVEMDYDKKENKPKQILADLAPLILERLLGSREPEVLLGAAKALSSSLSERHILLFSQDKRVQSLIQEHGWAGELIPFDGDYLSVVNTNINGFKTDAVIAERISHKAEIGADGSVIDTVKITREHKGGNTGYEWYDKVNADYLRVYVPSGSELLEVSGQTRETVKPALEYDALGFGRDEDVRREEEAIRIDPQSGTRIYEESGKTVFANWVYVSPGETAEIIYRYRTPLRLFAVARAGDKERSDTYKLLVQKQSGSVGSEISTEIAYPDGWEMAACEGETASGRCLAKGILLADHFTGAVFSSRP